LASFINTVTPGKSRDQIKEILRNNYGYGALASIPDYPSWEIAKWVRTRSDFPAVGEYPNDRINISTLILDPFSTNRSLETPFGCFADRNLSAKIKRISGVGYNDIPDIAGRRANPAGGPSTALTGLSKISYVKKTINLNRDAVPWMADYSVNVSFLNCVPTLTGDQSSDPQGIWIDKRPNYFTIYIAWPSREYLFNNGELSLNPARLREGNDFAGFYVINKELEEYNLPKGSTWNSGSSGRNNGSGLGVCIYPTVKFEITGIPAGYFDPTRTFTEDNDTISLI